MANPELQSERLPTGVPGLDELLGGGLMRNRSVLLKGAPGSGKTTLGLQMLVNGAIDHGEPGIFLSFEQTPDQIVSDAHGFGWDLKKLAEDKGIVVLFVEPKEVLAVPSREDNRLLTQIADWVDDLGSRRILIDSVSHLRSLYSGEEARSAFLNFVMQLKGLGLTPLMTSELIAGEGTTDLDTYLVDAVVHLTYHTGGVGQPDRREIELVKTRGYRHVPGAHPYEIGAGGIKVFPHIYPESTDDAKQADGGGQNADARVSSGVEGVDSLLSGGYGEGSSVLVTGLSGTFKSTLAAHFLLAASQADQPALWIAFQESRADIERAFAGMEQDLAGALAGGRLHIMECTTGREPVEKILAEAESLIAEYGIKRVAIDGMDELTEGLASVDAKQEGAAWFLKRLKAADTTVLFTQRLARETGRNPLSDIVWAELADTIIYLGLIEIESRLEKVISVLKNRGGEAVEDLRAVHRRHLGLEVSDRFVGMSGVLGGAPAGQRKAQIEKIFQPLFFIRDFLKVAQDPELDSDRRAGILGNVAQQTSNVIELLGEYFDEPVDKTDSGKGGEAGS